MKTATKLKVIAALIVILIGLNWGTISDLWKTNKEKLSSDYPAYVVHFTDYSAGRKDPLKREVRLAPDEATAKQIADSMIENNIKKGWEKVE